VARDDHCWTACIPIIDEQYLYINKFEHGQDARVRMS
jgi:hypothetical protein